MPMALSSIGRHQRRSAGGFSLSSLAVIRLKTAPRKMARSLSMGWRGLHIMGRSQRRILAVESLVEEKFLAIDHFDDEPGAVGIGAANAIIGIVSHLSGRLLITAPSRYQARSWPVTPCPEIRAR